MTKLTALPLMAFLAGCCPCPPIPEPEPAPMADLPDPAGSSESEDTGAPECTPYCCDAAWENCHAAPCAEGDQLGSCACWSGAPECGPDGTSCCV